MTVTYTAQVATCKGFGCFLKLLFRWRGSIYKLVWLDLICFLTIYYVLNITYRIALNEGQKRTFEAVVKYCDAYSTLIPLSFVLGFYVQVVMTRWWNQYISIPWPDSIAVFVSTIIHGQDERGRVMRRTIMRYVCLCLTLVFRNIAPRVKKRFPTLEHFVEAGLLLENERLVMENLNTKFPPYSKHWLPIVWAASIVTRARKEGRIRDDFAVKTVIDELNKFRGQCGVLISYDTISIPLVYTQVVTLAVYSFFIASVMGQQWVENKSIDPGYLNMIDLYFPFFTTLQFFFYMGWLKVAESLINPFGEDDDDFELNWMIDRNLQVSYIIVDEMHHDHPELIKDQYWDEVLPSELPHTIASQSTKEVIPLPSTDKVIVTNYGAEVIQPVPSSIKVNDMVGKSNQSVNYKFSEHENELMDDEYGIEFTARPRTSGSTNSMKTLARVSTVASTLKKFFHRDGDQSLTPQPTTPQLSNSASSISLNKYPQTSGQIGKGSVRIPHQVIEELDEQLTITSARPSEIRPNVQDVFKDVPPQTPLPSSAVPTPTTSTNLMFPSTAPIDIPRRGDYNLPYMRTQSIMSHVGGDVNLFPPGGVEALLSASAPANDPSILSTTVINNTRPLSTEYKGDPTKSTESIVSTRKDRIEVVNDGNIVGQDNNPPPQTPLLPENDSNEDEFEKLRLVREQEKLERQKQKLTRTVSLHTNKLQEQGLLAVSEIDLLIDEPVVKAADEEGEPPSTPGNPEDKTNFDL